MAQYGEIFFSLVPQVDGDIELRNIYEYLALRTWSSVGLGWYELFRMYNGDKLRIGFIIRIQCVCSVVIWVNCFPIAVEKNTKEERKTVNECVVFGL